MTSAAVCPCVAQCILFCTALARRVLQPLVVHGEALHQVLAQARRGPLPELRAAVTADAVADGKDGFQTVVFDVAGDLSAAFSPNYSESPNSWPRGQFALVPDAPQVLVHGWHGHLEQFGDLGLREPDGFVLQPAPDARAPVLRLVEENLGLRKRLVTHALTAASGGKITPLLLRALPTSHTAEKTSPP